MEPYFIAVDPGTTESAYVQMEGERLIEGGKIPNRELVCALQSPEFDHLAVEMVASYGKPVGEEVFETCLWIGRFIQAFRGQHTKIKRAEVKMHLCHTMKGVNDSVIRQRLIDLYGGKEKAIGKKKSPGPLYELRGDQWQALAVARTWLEKYAALSQSA